MKRSTILLSFLIVAILIIFVFNQMLSILTTFILLVIAVLLYVLSPTFKKKLIQLMSKYNRIIDTDIAQELNYPIQKLRDKLCKLHKHQKIRIGLAVFLNNRYIFYNSQAINEFITLHTHYLREKDIFENLKASIGLKTRAEVKAIKDTLKNQKKIEEKYF